MTKKITHEQAREVMMKLESEDVYYGEYVEEHKIMATYIKQQEKQEKLLELYKRFNNLYEEFLTMELSKLSFNSNYYEIEFFKLKQQIKELEKEIEND